VGDLTAVARAGRYRGGVTTPRTAVAPADASALTTVRGLRAWGAVLVAALFTIAGIVLSRLAYGSLGWLFTTCFVAGTVAAVLAVRRGSIFTAMVQPPLLLAPAVLMGSWLGSKQGLVYNGFDVVKAFPLMAISTAVVLVLALVRIIAQPIHRAPRKTAHRQAAV
jgi:hypothetical protein